MRLLMPLAPKLEVLWLGGNKLGRTITGEIAAFTKLTALNLADMGLDGACLCRHQCLHKNSRARAQAPSRRQSASF